jgi:tetratricopeptide (TPR) repeat protein
MTRLGEDASAVSELEAMIVLGLAHPEVLDQYRIPLVQEARRLAVLLEKNGEAERAQSLLELLAACKPGDRSVERELGAIMRRTGSLDRLVERHLRRAEEAMREGHREEAVRWLREVLLFDSSRRDVARMIRDLRYETTERRAAWRKRLQRVAVFVALAGAVAFVVWREMRIEDEYHALPGARAGDVRAMRERLAQLDSWMDDNPIWLGMLDAVRERSRLRTEIEKIEAAAHEQERQQAAARARAETSAEAERVLGRRAAERSEFAEARKHFEQALKVAPPNWAPRAQVETDIAAIDAWAKQGQGDATQGKRQ